MATKTAIRVTGMVGLSNREIKMVQMLADEYERKDMSEVLGLSVRTIEGEVIRIKSKTGCKTMGGLVALFMRNKLIK